MVSQFRSRTRRRTPLSNTGLLSSLPVTTAQIDWLQGVLSLTSQEFHSFKGQTSTTFADTFAPDQGYFFSGRAFEHHQISGRGAMICWNIRKSHEDSDDRHYLEEKIYDVYFRFPAKFLGGCTQFYLLTHFFLLLNEWDPRLTRIDSALDDYSKSLPFEIIANAIDNGVHHGFKSAPYAGDRLKDGYTQYLGSRNSDKLVRYYNKSVESGGEVDSYRFEVEWKDGYAQNLWKGIIMVLKHSSNSEHDLKKLLVDTALSSVDFYSLKNPDNKNSEKIYEQWWLDFKVLFEASQLKIRINRIKTSIDRTCEWMEHQVETSLAMIENFYEKTGQDFAEWINARIESGRKRLTDFHLNKVESQICYNDSITVPAIGVLF